MPEDVHRDGQQVVEQRTGMIEVDARVERRRRPHPEQRHVVGEDVVRTDGDDRIVAKGGPIPRDCTDRRHEDRHRRDDDRADEEPKPEPRPTCVVGVHQVSISPTSAGR